MSEKSLSETYGIKFYIKTDAELELEFQSNKKLNENLAPEFKLPETIVEYAERLIVENRRSIESIAKENIPDFIKTERLKYLQKHEQLLTEWLNTLKSA